MSFEVEVPGGKFVCLDVPGSGLLVLQLSLQEMFHLNKLYY